MNNYVVLLRGINVGGKNILPMKELTSLLEHEGYENVNTYIQSGNVVLSASKDPRNEIGGLVYKKFGFTPEVVTLTEGEFNASVLNNPYRTHEGKFVHFYFCNEAPNIDIEKLEKLAIESERYTLTDQVFYLHTPDGFGRSKLAAKVESCLGVSATARNLNTINKLKTMLENV
jgi:uncharacterized protein (DUF1697 family)